MMRYPLAEAVRMYEEGKLRVWQNCTMSGKVFHRCDVPPDNLESLVVLSMVNSSFLQPVERFPADELAKAMAKVPVPVLAQAPIRQPIKPQFPFKAK